MELVQSSENFAIMANEEVTCDIEQKEQRKYLKEKLLFNENPWAENVNEMLIATVKEIDYGRNTQKLDIMEFDGSINDGIRAFILLMLETDTGNQRKEINNALNETETLKYDSTKEDPFKHVIEQWNEFDDNDKRKIYKQLTTEIINNTYWGSKFSEIMKKTIKQCRNLNKLELKVNVLRYCIFITNDLKKWDKIGNKIMNNRQEIDKFNEKINGWFYKKKYIYSEYSRRYKINSQLLKKYHLKERKKITYHGEKKLYAIFEIMDIKNYKIYQLKVIFRFIDENVSKQVYDWDIYLFKKIKHKNIIDKISAYKDVNNYYIITPVFRRPYLGFIGDVQRISNDPLIREKFAASCIFDILSVLKHLISKNRVPINLKEKPFESLWQFTKKKNKKDSLMFTDWSSLDRTENEKELKQFE
eukprot:405405_1